MAEGEKGLCRVFFIGCRLFVFCIRLFFGVVVVCAIWLLLAFIFFFCYSSLFCHFFLRQTALLASRSEANTDVASATYTVQGTKSFLRFYCVVERLKTEFVEIKFNFEETLVIFYESCWELSGGLLKMSSGGQVFKYPPL